MADFIIEHQEQLRAFLERRTGGHLLGKIEVDDLLQEVLTDAVQQVEQRGFTPDAALPWLYSLCERKIIDAHRRLFGAQKRAASREAKLGSSVALEELLIASMTTPSAAFSRNEKELRMLAALESLPEDQQEALRLRYLQGMASKEIAESLGKSDGATRVLLSRGLKRLQALLEM